jgi:thiol-disulfide isomerase/thioredoxin
MRFCDNVDTVVTLLSDKVKNGIMKPIYDNEINIYKFEKKRKAQLINIAVGKKASDFTLKDINGKDVSLLSLRGKYVIIDFWGSWCHACIHGIPNMKEMYAKYHPTGKFEILNIDCSDTDVKWHETVKKYDMPWLNVKVPNGNNLLSVYAIRTFPTKFVIDPNGIIIYTIEGEDTSFYEYISMLFKDK